MSDPLKLGNDLSNISLATGVLTLAAQKLYQSPGDSDNQANFAAATAAEISAIGSAITDTGAGGFLAAHLGLTAAIAQYSIDAADFANATTTEEKISASLGMAADLMAVGGSTVAVITVLAPEDIPAAVPAAAGFLVVGAAITAAKVVYDTVQDDAPLQQLNYTPIDTPLLVPLPIMSLDNIYTVAVLDAEAGQNVTIGDNQGVIASTANNGQTGVSTVTAVAASNPNAGVVTVTGNNIDQSVVAANTTGVTITPPSGTTGLTLGFTGGAIGDSLNYAGQIVPLAGATSATVTSTAATIDYGAAGAPPAVVTINANGTGSVTATQPGGTPTTQTFTTTAQAFSEVGSTFGSALGNVLAGSNQFAQIGASALLGTVTADLGGLIGTAVGGGTTADIVTAFGNDLSSFGSSLLTSVEGTAGGALGSFLSGDLLNALGITGIPGEVLNVAVSTTIGTISTNLIKEAAGVSGVSWDSGLDIGAFENAFAGFVGTQLGSLVYSASTPQGAEGAQVGSAVGGILGSFIPIPIIGTLLGSFVGEIIGGLIGDLFGQAHTSHISEASFLPSISGTGALSFTFSTSSYQNGPLADAQSTGNAITASLDSIVSEIGGTVTNASSLIGFGIGFNTDASPSTDVTGYYNSNGGMAYYYDVNGTRSQYWAQNASTLTTVLDYAETRVLSQLTFSGGDQYMIRALDAGLRSSVNPTMLTVSGDIQLAKDYETYEANKVIINALIAADPGSTFAAAWVTELAMAAGMGLGTAVQGSTGNDTLGVVNTVDNSGNAITDRILIGGGGSDTYDYNATDGNVTIVNGLSSNNVAAGALTFGSGIGFMTGSASNISSVSLRGADLILTMTGAHAGTVDIEGWLAGSYADLTQLTFGGGATSVSESFLAYMANAPGAYFNVSSGQFTYPSSGQGLSGSNSFTSTSSTLSGGAGGDVLVGGSGANTFILGGGNDVVYGGGAGDTYDLDATGQLTIYNNENGAGVSTGATTASGTLHLNAGIGFDQLRAVKSLDGQDLYITAGTSSVFVGGWFTSDGSQLNSIRTADGTTITYTDGNNYLHGATATNIYGISSAENYYFSGTTAFLVNYYNVANAEWEHDVVNSDGSSITTVELAGVGRIRDANTIIANAASDTLTGDGAGTVDTLWAQGGSSTAAGNDTLIGGAGTSMLLSDVYGETLVDGAGTSVATYNQAGVTVNLAAGTAALGSSNLHDTLINITVVQGGGSSDTLTGGSSGTATLIAAGANDTLIGGSAGTTTLIGDGNSGVLTGGAGVEVAGYQADDVTVNVTAGTAQVNGTTVHDTFSAITRFAAFGANDTLLGGTGASVLIAAGVSDTLIAGTGTTSLTASGSDDTLIGTTGNDIFIASGSSNTIVANGGSDTLTTTGANDSLILGAGMTLASLTFTANGSDVIVGSSATTSKVTLKNWATDANAGSQTITTSDGFIVSYVPAYGLFTYTSPTNSFGIKTTEYWDATGLQTWASQTNYINAVGFTFEQDVVSTNGKLTKTLIGDSLSLTGGADTLVANGASDTLIGGAGADLMYATGTGDTLQGGAGANVLNASGSTDRMVGSTGNDTFTASGASDRIITGGGTDIVTMTGASDAVVLGSGMTGASLVFTKSGNNEIITSTANDSQVTLKNFFVAGNNDSTQTVTTSDGEVLSYVGAFGVFSYTSAPDGNGIKTAETWDAIGAQPWTTSTTYINAVGTSIEQDLANRDGTVTKALLADSLSLTGGADTLVANGASDTLIGGAGADLMYATGTGDTLQGGAGANVLNASGSTDRMVGSTGNDTFTASGASDRIVTGGGTDIVTMTGASDAVVLGSGMTGASLVFTKSGNNEIITSTANASQVTLKNFFSTDTNSSTQTVTTSDGEVLSYVGMFGIFSYTSAPNAFGVKTAYAWDALGVQSWSLKTSFIDATNTDLEDDFANRDGTVTKTLVGDGLSLTGGADTLVASGASDTLIGGAGADLMYATGTGDTLQGGAGANVLNASGSTDRMVGSTGNDTFTASGASDRIITGGGTDIVTMTGASDAVVLTGTPFYAASLVFTKSGNNEIITGTTGSVTLKNFFSTDTNAGTQTVTTGDGEVLSYAGLYGVFGYTSAPNQYGIKTAENWDALGVQSWSTKLTFFDATNTDIEEDLANRDGTVTKTLLGDGLSLTGADTLVASGASDTLIGGAGADLMYATGTGDTLQGGAGANVLNASGSTDRIVGGTGNDTITASGANERIITGGGVDIVTTTGANAAVVLGSGMTGTSLVFNKVGNNEIITSTANGSQVTLKNFATDANAGSLTVTTSDGEVLTYGTGFALFSYTSAPDANGIKTTETWDAIGAQSWATTATYINGVGVSFEQDQYNRDGTVMKTLLVDSLSLTGGADTLVANGASDTLIGDAGNDLMFATGTGDTLQAGAGNNVLTASGSTDRIVAGSGNDTITASGANDRIITGGGTDIVTMTGASDALVLTGTPFYAANISFSRSGNNEIITGSTGSVTLKNFYTADTASGSQSFVTGDGDTLAYSGTAATFGETISGVVQEVRTWDATGTLAWSELDKFNYADGSGQFEQDQYNRSGTVWKTLQGDSLSLAGGADSLIATGAHDKLTGGSTGTMVLFANGSSDTLVGGSGGVTQMRGHSNGSTLIDGAGVSYVVYNDASSTVNLATGTAMDTGTGAVADKLIGITVATALGDSSVLIAGTVADTLTAGGTNETLITGTGASTLIATGTGDTLVGNSITDTLIGVTGDTTTYVIGNGQSGNLWSETGITIEVATGTNDKLYGTTQNADTITLYANGTTDTLFGGSGPVSQLNAYGTGDIVTGGSSGNSYLRAQGSGDTLIGGAGTAFLYGHANGSTLINGAGNTVAVYNDANSTVKLGTGTATDSGTGAVTDTLIGITVATVGGDGSYLSAAGAVADTLTGAGNNDTLVASTGASTLTATGTGDTLVAGAGASTLYAKGTGSFYDVPSTAGAITIQNGVPANTTAANELDFGSGLTDEKLWFVHSGNDLVIDQLGTAKSVTVKGWFTNSYDQLSEITAGGLSLDTKVNQLVAAMATYSAAHSTFDPTTATVMPTDSTLQTAITTSWHS